MPAAPKKGRRFGGDAAHHKAILANLACSLIEAPLEVGIETTEAKAKALRPVVEKLVTKARDGSVHHHRQIVSYLKDKDVAHRLVAEIAPLYAERPGGYLRILKRGPRPGDNAPMARIQFV